MKITKKVIAEREQTLLNFGMELSEGYGRYQYLDTDISMDVSSIQTLQPDVWGIATENIMNHITELKEAPKSLGELVEFEEVVKFNVAFTLSDEEKALAEKAHVANISKLKTLKERALQLTVSSLEDKKVYKTICAYRSAARTMRTGTEKARKQEVAAAVAYQRFMNLKCGEYEDLLVEIEAHYQGEMDKFKGWEDVEKLHKEQEEAKFLNSRVKSLIAAGMNFDGSYYSIGDPIVMSMDIASIKNYTETGFSSLLEAVKSHKALIDALAEEARKEEETRKENERIAREKFEADQKALEIEKANMETARLQMLSDRFHMRGERCEMAGMVYSLPKQQYEYNSEGYTTAMPKNYLETAENDAFNTLLADVSRQIKEAKEQAENKAAEAKRKADELQQEKEAREAKAQQEYSVKCYDLLNAGMSIIVADGFFIRKNEFKEQVYISISEVKAIDMDMWPSILLSIAAEINKLNASTDAKRNEIQEAKNAALPEIEQLKNYVAQFHEMWNKPGKLKFKTANVAQLFANFEHEIGATIDVAYVAIEQLHEKINAI